jgi:hypothetical protein
MEECELCKLIDEETDKELLKAWKNKLEKLLNGEVKK